MRSDYGYTDAELADALKQLPKMDDAIRFIFKNYSALLESYVLNNKGSKEDAADIIQETVVVFIEIIQQNKYRGEASIKSFLFSIARNLWLTELRKRNSAANRNKYFENSKEIIEQAAVTHLVKREHFALIQQLFEKLGEKCKQLLMLVYYEELPMQKIAEMMPDYQNEQVLRNKKYKCMKQLELLMQNNEVLKVQFKNALKYAG
jgi:RNA polymerase sigma factor (sigma-70 family)